jgi:short-subunit dehydrogenase
MGRSLARLLAARGDDLILWGRDTVDLQASSADLSTRAGRSEPFPVLAVDLEHPEGFAGAVEKSLEILGGVDLVVVTAASFGTQEELEADPERARRLLMVNFANTVALCEAVRPALLASQGALCVFSSVAGDRGRKPVGLYGASKAGLSHYLESLDHRYHAQGLRVVCVKPGFVRTAMTEGLPAPPFAGEPEGVAKDVLRAIDKGKPVVYTPRMWGLVMLIIRHLPRFVMRRVGF